MSIQNANEPLVTRKHLPKNGPKLSFPPMGSLKNGNQPGNPNNAPRCHAKCRKKAGICQSPAMANGRCRLHGGLSTGPRTQEGLERSRKANWKHGAFSTDMMEMRRVLRLEYQEFTAVLKQIREIT